MILLLKKAEMVIFGIHFPIVREMSALTTFPRNQYESLSLRWKSHDCAKCKCLIGLADSVAKKVPYRSLALTSEHS